MEKIIEDFYTSFANLDAEGMVIHYHPEVIFEDPAFGQLKGERAIEMWKMLCESQKNKDFVVKVSDIRYSNGKGTAKWEAFYTFSRTGRKVHNKINAEFKLKDNKIIEHRDNFNLHRWSVQALGIQVFLIGWTAFFKRRLNVQTNKLLSRYIEKKLLSATDKSQHLTS